MNEQEDSRNQTGPVISERDGAEQCEPQSEHGSSAAVRDEEGRSASCISDLPVSDSQLDGCDSLPAAVDDPSGTPEACSLDDSLEKLVSEVSEQSRQLGTIVQSLTGVEERLVTLEKRPTVSPRVLQQIEQRLQELSADGLVQSKRSLLKDVVALYDLAVTMGRTVDTRETMPVEEFCRRLSLMADQIAQVLQLNGLEAIQSDPGTPFDPKLHCAGCGILCEDANMHHTIKAVHAMGLRSKAHVFRPASVDVWVWKPLPEAASTIVEQSVASEGMAPGVAKATSVVVEDAIDEPCLKTEPDHPVASDDRDSNGSELLPCPGGSPVERQTDCCDDLVGGQ